MKNTPINLKESSSKGASSEEYNLHSSEEDDDEPFKYQQKPEHIPLYSEYSQKIEASVDQYIKKAGIKCNI